MMSVPAFHVMTKPIGPICNLDCKYCFYVEKEELYPGGENFKMSDELLERYISQYIAQQSVPEIHFAWRAASRLFWGCVFSARWWSLKKITPTAGASTTRCKPTALCSIMSGVSFWRRTNSSSA